MRTRLFLRTAEFLWQEGHTAHSTAQEAIEETEKMLDVYADFAENWMAMPVIKGRKTANERFAGAVDTMCIEALMQDGKALQAGTSHFLGQNFAKAFDVKFVNKEGVQDYVWATSWGVSTRLMGALIMTHSDDKGLRLPPKLAPIHVVVVPIYKGVEQIAGIYDQMKPTIDALKAKGYTVKFDDDDTKRSGWKFAEYELKGVPVRIAVGQRDLDNGTIEVARRDSGEKMSISIDGAADQIHDLLENIQGLGCGGGAVVLVEGKKLFDPGGETRWQVGTQRGQRCEIMLKVGCDESWNIRALERRRASEGLVKDTSEGINIRTVVDRLAAELLRGDHENRTRNRAGVVHGLQ
jgi:prolyl-tRNA synthetase